MAGTFAYRLSFLVAAALMAAGAGDSVVESISNTGIFGLQYADNNHLGVVPTLFAGVFVALEILVLRFLEVWRGSVNRSHRALLDAARDIGMRSVAGYFPFIFGLQLAFVFAIESAEGLAAGGKLPGGSAWLGGPVGFSLLAHAVMGGVCTLALGAGMRAIVRAFASIVQSAVRFIWLAIGGAPNRSFQLGLGTASCAGIQAPPVRQIGGRAPPLLSIPA